jgi:hypothetical protein
MIYEEGHPLLGGLSARSDPSQISRDRPLGDLGAELPQLTMDSWSALGGILAAIRRTRSLI